MTLDHFSGPISHYLYQCFGFFSAAEGFFFLSGFVGMLAVISKTGRGENSNWMQKRAFRIWKYHIISVTVLALAAFFFLPRIRCFFEPLYAHPFSGLTLATILAYTPEWLDVLPLYVILLLIGSFAFPLIANGHLKAVLGISFAVWALAQGPLRVTILQIFPSWMHPGFFDLFAWQFVYFSGAAVSYIWKRSGSAFNPKSKDLDKLFPFAVSFCFFCLVWSHGFIPLPHPRDLFISKEHVGILRYVNFIAFVGVIAFVVRHRPKWLDFNVCRTLGKHSLEVYSAHTILVYLWMATPAAMQYHLPYNVISPLLCCAMLWGLAKIKETKM